MSTLVLYPEELDPENFCFQWPTRIKMQLVHQFFFKERNGDHKSLRCPDLQYNNFEVMRSESALGKINHNCAENVKAKPTGNDSDFMTY